VREQAHPGAPSHPSDERDFQESFSCRLGGATFEENIVPSWTREDFRGVWGRDQLPGVRC
jgi:hypothetical protein